MNLHNYFYYFQGALSQRLCNHIIEYGNSQRQDLGFTGGFPQNNNYTDEELSKLKKQRNSNIAWINDWWISKAILPFVDEANKAAGWNFDLEGSENFQFTKYGKTQHYDWHQDSFPTPYGMDAGFHQYGKTRKLSVTVSLADGNDYEGGDFQIDFRNRSDSTSNFATLKEARQKGSIIVFPSFVWHRVTPVTSGTRYSLVAWTLGYPFR